MKTYGLPNSLETIRASSELSAKLGLALLWLYSAWNTDNELLYSDYRKQTQAIPITHFKNNITTQPDRFEFVSTVLQRGLDSEDPEARSLAQLMISELIPFTTSQSLEIRSQVLALVHQLKNETGKFNSPIIEQFWIETILDSMVAGSDKKQVRKILNEILRTVDTHKLLGELIWRCTQLSQKYPDLLTKLELVFQMSHGEKGDSKVNALFQRLVKHAQLIQKLTKNPRSKTWDEMIIPTYAYLSPSFKQIERSLMCED